MIEMQYNFPLLPGLPAQWRERLRAAVDELSNDFDALRPSFRSRHDDLVRIAAGWKGVPPERTYLTEGMHHGSLIAMMAARVAGKPIAVDAVAYTGTLEQARALRSPVVGCAVDDDGLVPESLREECVRMQERGTPIRALYLIPTVHNPLGYVMGEERRRALVEVARAFDLYILEDDAYGFMEPGAPLPVAALAPERTFFITGLSKSYAPAARTGFLVAPEAFDGEIWAAIKNTATGTSLVHNTAACSLLADGSVDRVIAAKVEEGRARNAAARALLGECCRPSARAGWHLWVSLPGHVSAEDFEQRMAEEDVALSGGHWFVAREGAPHGFRIALGGEVDRDRMLEGVRRIAEKMKAFT